MLVRMWKFVHLLQVPVDLLRAVSAPAAFAIVPAHQLTMHCQTDSAHLPHLSHSCLVAAHSLVVVAQVRWSTCHVLGRRAIDVRTAVCLGVVLQLQQCQCAHQCISSMESTYEMPLNCRETAEERCARDQSPKSELPVVGWAASCSGRHLVTQSVAAGPRQLERVVRIGVARNLERAVAADLEIACRPIARSGCQILVWEPAQKRKSSVSPDVLCILSVYALEWICKRRTLTSLLPYC